MGPFPRFLSRELALRASRLYGTVDGFLMHSTHCAVYLSSSFLCIAIRHCHVLDLISNRSGDIYPGVYAVFPGTENALQTLLRNRRDV